MIVSNVSLLALENARALASLQYECNVVWNRKPEALNRVGTRWRLTLRVKNSRGPGSSFRVHFGKTRRLVSACWHVHGTFFDALPDGAIVFTARRTFVAGSEWQDYNVGSLEEPLYASEACNCYST